MKISAKNGLLTTIAGLAGLYVAFGTAFSCYKSECNELAYSAAVIAIVSILVVGIGLIMFLVGVFRLAKHDPKKRYWLLAVVLVYFAIALGVYYYFLGGNRNFEAKSFQENFKSTYFTVGYLPDSYEELHTSYASDGDSDVFGPGNYASTQFGKPLTDGNGDRYYVEFTLKQGDALNDAAGILAFCGKNYDCDVVDGQHVKNIHCQQHITYVCSVLYEGTYISLSNFETNDISREESVAILDSLVPRKH